MPKGVMWRQDDLFGALDASNRRRMPPEQDLDALGGRIVAAGPRNLPAAPLMHGTGFFNAVSNLMLGGSVTTMVGRRFDAVELLDTVERFSINSMSIVGDAFAKPILRALDAEPDRWDISSLRVIVSSGVIWSQETKDGLLRHNDRLIMVDSLGSSEAIGMATNTTRAGEGAGTARFSLGPNTRVVTEDGRDVVPGSGERGRVALRGFTPVGLLQGPGEVGGDVPGDRRRALLDPRRLGRGRGRRHGQAARPWQPVHQHRWREGVPGGGRGGAQAPPARSTTRPSFGVPDERFGEAITALVEPNPGATVDEAELIAHVKEKLAAFKAPKRVLSVEHRRPGGERQARLPPAAVRSTRPPRSDTPRSDIGVSRSRGGVASTLDQDVPADRLGRLRRRAVRPRRRDHADRRSPRARVGRAVQRLRLHARRLPGPHRRPAALRRRTGVPPLTRHRAARRAPDRSARQPHDLRDGEPQERRLQRGAGRRGNRAVPGVDGRDGPARRGRGAAGDRVVVEERPPGARRGRARRSLRRRGRRGHGGGRGARRQAGARHVPAGRRAARRRSRTGRSSSRTRSPASRPARTAVSASCSASTAAAMPRRSPPTAPMRSSTTSAETIVDTVEAEQP